MSRKEVKSSQKTLGHKLVGLATIALAVFIAIALATYDARDASLSVATTSREVRNWGGSIGAYSSDVIIQILGSSSILLVILISKGGLDVLRNRRSKYRGILSWIYAVLAVLAMSFISQNSCAGHNIWGFSNCGGVLGVVTFGLLSHMPLYIDVLTAWMVLIFSLSIVFELDGEWWAKNITRLYLALAFILRNIWKAMGFLTKRIIPSKISRKVKNAMPFGHDDSFYEDDPLDDGVNKKPTEPRAAKKGRATTTIGSNGRVYHLPPLDLLDKNKNDQRFAVSKEELSYQANQLATVLGDFGIKGELTGSKTGPIVTLYEFEPAAGTKSARVIGLADDIARSMSALSARISTIPGRSVMGIELPNKKRATIYLRDVLESSEYKNSKASLPIILGENIGGDPVIADLAKMPHLLVAGTTGSGKSVGINTMIMSILYRMTPDECKFIMIDPKMLELSVYEGVPHLLMPVVTESGKAVIALKWVVQEMEERYRTMAALGVRNIGGYNDRIAEAESRGEKLTRRVQTGFDRESDEAIFEDREIGGAKMPYIVVVVDEMADLMITSGKEIEASIQRLAQMARAAGIHIIMATQRPSVDIITGVIKANFPTRISFQVTSKIDSRTILGEQGGEQLLGMGDMLFMAGGGRIIRAHGPFVSDSEIANIVSFIKAQGFEPEYLDESLMGQDDVFTGSSGGAYLSGDDNSEEGLYRRAVEIVKTDKKTSISYVQRQLRVGYNKAANLIERMEDEGILGPAGRNGKREILED